MCHVKIELCSWRAPTSDVTTAEHNTVDEKHYIPHQALVRGHVLRVKALSSVAKVLWVSRTPYIGESGV